MYPPPHMTHVSSSSYDTCILLLMILINVMLFGNKVNLLLGHTVHLWLRGKSVALFKITHIVYQLKIRLLFIHGLSLCYFALFVFFAFSSLGSNTWPISSIPFSLDLDQFVFVSSLVWGRTSCINLNESSSLCVVLPCLFLCFCILLLI